MRVAPGFAGSFVLPHPIKHPHHPKKDGVTVTVATINDDFTDHKTGIRNVKDKASVVLMQEAKNTRLRDVLSDRFGVHQNFKRDDQAGAAVAWNRDDVKVVDRGYALGVTPQGHALLSRYMNWTDMKIDGKNVRMVSVHRPPPRDSELWPAFNRNLAAFVKNHKGPIIIGMDANHRDPQRMETATGLKWVAPKGSVDGFLVSKSITVEGDSLRRLDKGPSDHHPVVAKFRIGG